MTHLDAIAASSLTAAILITVFYLRQRALERQRDRAREQRDTARAEAAELRLSRVALTRPWAGHVDDAIEQTRAGDERYWPVDRAGYLPVFEGDNPVLAEYRSTAAALRRAGTH